MKGKKDQNSQPGIGESLLRFKGVIETIFGDFSEFLFPAFETLVFPLALL